MKIKVYILSSFNSKLGGGNLAGVLLDADKLSERQMQIIAKKMGFSETAFVQKSKKADFKIRSFATITEVPMCGHATIAAFYLLLKKGKIQKKENLLEVKAGLLKINIRPDESVYMTQKLPVFSKIIDKKIMSKCLNISINKIRSLPIQIVSTGFPTIIVPIERLATLKKMNPDLNRCKKLCNKKLLIHAFTQEYINSKSIAYSRNFFPDKTLDEESATGSSTGALACYLYKYHLLTGNKYQHLAFEQGYFMNQPSEILVDLIVQNNKIQEVWVGGKIALINEKIVTI